MLIKDSIKIKLKSYIYYNLIIRTPQNCFPAFLTVLATLNTTISPPKQRGDSPNTLYEPSVEETLCFCESHEEHEHLSLRDIADSPKMTSSNQQRTTK